MMQPSPPRGLIDPNWELIDLDPVTWRTIGKFLQPALYVQAGPEEENGLFIIHDAGELLQITTSGGGDAEIGIDRVSDPRRLAVTLQNSGKWDRVHVIDRQHLRDVSRKAQTPEHSRMALDEYYRLVFHLVWDGGDGYVAEPPHPGHWNHWTYAGIEQFASQLRETAALSLGVFDGDRLSIGLIAVLREGVCRKVTTFEALAISRNEIALTQGCADRLWEEISDRISTPAVQLLCTQLTFDAWIASESKWRTIEAAVAAGDAC